jgi:hypothetical protein
MVDAVSKQFVETLTLTRRRFRNYCNGAPHESERLCRVLGAAYFGEQPANVGHAAPAGSSPRRRAR